MSFIDEDLDVDFISKKIQENSNIGTSDDFLRLKESFNQLTKGNNIVYIHNAGFDIEEGIQDSFELYTHLINNNLTPSGFCF